MTICNALLFNVVRLCSTSGPNTRFGNASSLLSHNAAEFVNWRRLARYRSQIGRAWTDRVRLSIVSDASPIFSSGNSSLKLTVTWSRSQIGSDGNPTAIPSVIAHKTRGSPSFGSNVFASHARNRSAISCPTSLNSGTFVLKRTRSRCSSRAPPTRSSRIASHSEQLERQNISCSGRLDRKYLCTRPSRTNHAIPAATSRSSRSLQTARTGSSDRRPR